MGTIIALFTFGLAIFDAFAVATFVVTLIKQLGGDTPSSRLFRVLGGIASCGLYGYWAIYKTAEFWSSTEDISPMGMIIPLAIPLVLIFIQYVMNGSGDNGNGGNDNSSK